MMRIFLLNKKDKEKESAESGFSLMEVLVAVSILIVALLGVLILVSNTMVASRVSSSKLVAANLAQEGIEVVKNIRDANFTENGWADWFASAPAEQDYIVQYSDDELRVFSDVVLKYDSASGLYGYDSGADTDYAYKRKITITKISDNELKVVARLDWVESGRAQTLSVEDHLWNWR